eukprot:6197447-Pleurochrysis_carterae.AAC.1
MDNLSAPRPTFVCKKRRAPHAAEQSPEGSGEPAPMQRETKENIRDHGADVVRDHDDDICTATCSFGRKSSTVEKVEKLQWSRIKHRKLDGDSARKKVDKSGRASWSLERDEGCSAARPAAKAYKPQSKSLSV